MKSLKIGIILGSTRKGRMSPQVGEWVLNQTKAIAKADYELIDIKDYQLPLLGEAQSEGIKRFKEKIDTLDGFVFVTCEYNHGISGALKNALDHARDEWYHKAAGIVSYGSAGGVRAAEQLRLVLGELNIADVRTQVFFSLFDDFKDNQFTPRDVHLDNMQQLFKDVNAWAEALRHIRT